MARGVTQYTFSVEQLEVLISSAATGIMNGRELAIVSG